MNKTSKRPSLLSAWLSATRLRTLPIPTIQVVVGLALAYSFLGFINITTAFFTWAVAVCITIGTNLLNDVYDHEKGGDQEGSAGYKKVITAGLLSAKSLYVGGLISFLIAILCSIPLAFESSFFIFFLVIFCCFLGFCYTGGPYPICYMGLSEVFILGFYGFVLVGVSFYIQTGDFMPAVFLSALQMGLLAIIPNALNNFRDIDDDEKVNKLTLAVRFGEKFARNEITFLTIAPFLLSFCWFKLGFPEAAFLSFLLVPLGYYFIHGIRNQRSGPALNPYFPISILFHFGFGALLSFGFILRS